MIHRAQVPGLAAALARIVPVLAALVCLAACGEPSTSRPARSVPGDSERGELYDRADRTFDAGYLLKPAAGSASGSRFDLAPLLLQQTTDRRSESTPHLEGNPTVYVLSSSVEIHGRRYDQWIYLWWTPASPVTGQGIRVTVGSDGFPAIYEVLADSSGARSIFVTTTLEQAAAEAFGPPLPGRRFSIERPVDATPGVVVAGALEPGPVPLGPFVYLMEESHDVSTMLCRCMPSQVGVVVNSSDYRLVPLEDVESPGAPEPPWLRIDDAHSLERSLRLPSKTL